MSELVWPPVGTVSIQRLTDPLTGWAMLGAGLAWDSPSNTAPLQAEILLDGEPLIEGLVQPTATGYRFGLHAPLPKSPQRVRVQLRHQESQQLHLLKDESWADLTTTGPEVTPQQRHPKWLSPAMTLGQSVLTGAAFTPTWWTARYQRYQAMLIRFRQRLRDKLARRQPEFQPLTVHQAYVRATAVSPAESQRLQTALATWKQKPTISIVMPVYNVKPEWLHEAVESVRHQVYPHWQLCLADDASTDPDTRAALDQLPKDERIRLIRRDKNGHICAATNSAAELATGEFLAFMDNDDLLAPLALYRVAEALQTRPELDLLYSDEDKITEAGERYDPQFKPDWSPELLLSYNYINHFTVVRRSLFQRVGALRLGYEGAQDYDLLLRITEQTERIHHIPEILYHWRAHSGSTASTATQKPIVEISGRKGLEDALRRRGMAVTVAQPRFADELRLPILALQQAEQHPSVAIIVYGRSKAISATVPLLKANTAYPRYTIYLLLDAPELAEGLNRLAAARTEDYLLFWQAGLTPQQPDWLTQLMAHAQIPGVGAVGARLETAHGRIVSAGTVLNVTEDALPGDAFRGLKPEPVSYYFYAEVTRNVTAPSAGCLLTPRRSFEQVGGLDSRHYPQTLFDVDYCLRLAGSGLRAVHVGNVRLLGTVEQHGRHDAPTELVTFQQAYGRNPDPYHNPNLSDWVPFTPRSILPARIPPVDKPFSVVFGTHNLSAYEGVPKILFDVAGQLQQQGRVRAAFFASQPGRAAADLGKRQIRVFAVNLPYSPRFSDGQWTPQDYESAVQHLMKVFREVHAEVVLAGTLGLFPLVEAASRCGIPAILAIQESYSETVFQRQFSDYGRWRCERAFHFADRVIFASKSCADLYARLNSRQNFEIIHNGLDRQKFRDYQRANNREQAATQLGLPADGRVRIVSVGTICERKAQHHLVEAAKLLRDRGLPFRVYLVGARVGVPYLDFVKTLVRRHQLEDFVRLVPETDQVLAYLRSADVYVCCSYIEAHSLSVLESQAFGLPLVSTPCGGLDEQVIWNRSALRFDFGDTVQLADHLEGLIREPTRRAEFSRQAQAHFALHTDDWGMVQRYCATILQVRELRERLASRTVA